MKRDLNIILVEDDTEACRRFAEYVDITPNISILEITNDSYYALKLVDEFHPDAVILDLELNYGKGNGLLFLNSLKNAKPSSKPYILVTTNNSSNVTYDYSRECGADFIMSKHQEDYSEANAIDFLLMMKDIIQNNIAKQNNSYNTIETPDQYERRIKKRITIYLEKIGISPKLDGYRYLIDAIWLVVNGQTHNLCVTIGQQYAKTNSSIERAIQTAIDKAWKTTDINDLLDNYTARIRPEKGVPTMTEFIFYYANKIKNGY